MKYFFVVFLFVSILAHGQVRQSFTPQQIENYMSRISSMLAGRGLTAAERSVLKKEAFAGLESTLQKWVDEDFFVKSSRIQIQTQLGVSGNDGVINYELPANLLENLIRSHRPYSEILTSDFCVDNSGQKVACDSGAPFTAGVLTTRAYLKQYRGRFNLSRANNMLRQFACESYPMNTALQPRLPRESLITMFADNQAEGGKTFGNGSACYSCHSQFGAHTQLFVKFDAFGMYKPMATGWQDPALEPGKSSNDLYTSHFNTPEQAKEESSQMFGRNVSNLREAAEVMVNNSVFIECAVRNSIRYFTRLDTGNETINTGVVLEISNRLKQKYRNPTFKEIVLESLKHPFVIGSVLLAGE